MKITKHLLTLSIAFALSACATSQTTAPNNVAVQKTASAETVAVSQEVKDLAKSDISNEKLAEKLVCRKETKTGTRMSKKVCRTKAEIEEAREQTQKDLADVQQGSVTRPPGQ